MAKSIITIETEKIDSKIKRTIKCDDRVIYESEIKSLFDYTDSNLLENIRRTLFEIDTKDNFSDTDYPNID